MEATAVIGVASTVASGYYSKKSSSLQKKQIKASNKAAQEEADLSKKQAELTLAEEKRKNNNLLKQNLSSYKARLGAQGLSTSYGSNQAVYDNMIYNTNMENKYLEEQANVSLDALLTSINQRTSRNLLTLTNMSYQDRSNLASSVLNAGRNLLQ